MTKITVPKAAAFWAYIGYAWMFLFGYVKDFLRNLIKKDVATSQLNGYGPLLVNFEQFYRRHCYRYVADAFNRPVASIAGPWIDVKERVTTDDNTHFKLTGNIIHCINLGSYNYLGLNEPKASVYDVLKQYGVSTGSSAMEIGTTDLHRAAERKIAQFLGKEAAIIVGMGFATNSLFIPALCGKGSLIISDSLNHSSIATGAKASGATVKIFQHNDVKNLESVVLNAIMDGQPRSHKPWDKILIIVEGIYSMEGEICHLPEICEIKKKYKCYLYVDEAHSIGALGSSGRGIGQYWEERCAREGGSFNRNDVDIYMGTFTKTFASVGGYIAASEDVINHLRLNALSSLHSQSVLPVCVEKINNCLDILMNPDPESEGPKKIAQLRENTLLFRSELIKRGYQVIGDMDSPVVPAMVYNPWKLGSFSRECLKRKLAIVTVGFPATPLIESRARFCMSSGHTKEELLWTLDELDKVGDLLSMRYARRGWRNLLRKLYYLIPTIYLSIPPKI